MVLGEVFLGAFLQVLLDRLSPRVIINSASLRGLNVDKKLKKWSSTLSAIGAMLYDAEEKQLTSEAVKLWLDDLKDLAYDVEDILDKFSIEVLRRRVKEQHGAATISKVRSLIPQAKFNFHMNSKIKEITDRLRDISERKEALRLNDIGMSSNHYRAWKMPPSSCRPDGPVIGRDWDKSQIVGFLSGAEPSAINFHVVAILGMAGVGKTTLAGHVFNDDDDAMQQFDLKVWVYVSDDFNIVRVTKAILESITSEHCKLKEFSKVQDNLSKELRGKKFLIVLDDVWDTCDYDMWTKLQSPFRVGALGSKILVTTRYESVARMMGAIQVHNLKCISSDDCWQVFEQHSFLNINNSRPHNIESLRDKIIAKCNGLPLAARMLGGLLRCKEIGEWEEILDNKLWSLSDKSGILPVLKLSYHSLPSNLKRCFAYCSILPNDYEFSEKQLILLWMAEGLIQHPEQSRQMEDLGGEYFQELLSRSLFQKSNKDSSQYVMHDLISELARWAAGEVCFRLEDNVDDNMQHLRCSPKARHSSYISGEFDGITKFVAFSEAKRLRTFLPFTLSENPQNYLTGKVTLDLVPKLQYLRVLSFNSYQITELPDSIGKLKYLQYLDVSHTPIRSLPESTSTLYNLQVLILESCSLLEALPTNMRNLINLRHLNNSSVHSLKGMPMQLGRLTNLQTLADFVVGKGSESGIREIGPLLHLRGTLHLSRLENVTDVEDARRADLISKKGLDVLLLQWHELNGMGEREANVLDMLQPHRKLKELTIRRYTGDKISAWVGSPSFTSMVLVNLEDCSKCRFLPPLGQLPSLKELFIKGMSGVESVGSEFYGEGSLPFPLLETLSFKNMQGWKEWIPLERHQGTKNFPCLKKLSIYACPKLEGVVPENLDSLEELVVRECDQLVVSIANYKELSVLCIRYCKGVVYRSVVDFQLLDLEITGCEELTCSLPNEDGFLQNLMSLRHLSIEGNSHLVQLHHLSLLQELHIDKWPSLVSFPLASLPPSLKDIKIRGCDSLTYFARYQIPPGLRRIEINRCQNLKALVEDEEAIGGSSSSSPCLIQDEESCLEYLSIWNCPSLISLSSRVKLPKALKHLQIHTCRQLESIADALHDNISLEYIHIWYCSNLQYLPEGLYHLSNLQKLSIYGCRNLVSFPTGGFPRSPFNLREFEITSCEKLEALPKGMHNLNSLEILRIPYYEGFTSFLEEGLPPNLQSLKVLNLKSCKPLFECGLHRLTSLRELWISGEDPELVSFPPKKEMVLPKSLIKLIVEDFPNLKYLPSKGFQSLTSLKRLYIWSCPKLLSIPDEGRLLSLTQLSIRHCPLLEVRCKPGKGQFWRSIAHIPYIWLGDKRIQAP
ncbi:hypothetical protein ABKV19_026908 [Rosa sericea]